MHEVHDDNNEKDFEEQGFLAFAECPGRVQFPDL
jgi:hypothetical protein